MQRLLTIYLVFGGIFVLRFSDNVVYGQQPLQFTKNNETHSEIAPASTLSFSPSSSAQHTYDRDQSYHDISQLQLQPQRSKASQKYPWPQKYSTGIIINNDSTRRNLTNQKQSWDRQGDDPNRSPIHLIQQKILQSEFSRSDDGQETNSLQVEEANGVRCNFEIECNWEWDKTQNNTFQVVNLSNVSDANSFISIPSRANENRGHFLYLQLLPSTTRTLKSPVFSPTKETCRLEVYAHQIGNKNGKLRIVIEPVNSHETTSSSWVPIERDGNDNSRWMEIYFPIGRVSQEFRILFEVVAKGLRPQQRAHVAIDNLRMRGCFKPRNQITAINGKCYLSDVKCKVNKIEVCIKPRQQCDINIDCDNKEDEMINCEKIPFGGMCDFENGWCGWHNSGKAIMVWERHSGPTPTERTGPDNDHTFGQFNASGHYLFVNMNQHANDDDKQKLSGFASNAVINSIIFNPPPFAHLNASSLYRHTCMARFYVHQFGKNTGSLNFSVVEIRDKENVTSTLWWSSRELGSEWARIQIIMPNITSRYFLQFEARMGMRIYSDVAIDDFSLSPECFGQNIPAEHLQGYNYYDQRILQDKTPHEDFVNHTVIELSTCNARGRDGPTPNDCNETYNNSELLSDIRVINENSQNTFKGVQVWRVPSENYYTIIAKGAGGGLGSRGLGSSRGALAISVFELRKDEDIHILVGQKGENACTRTHCNRDNNNNNQTTLSDPLKNPDDINSKTKQVKDLVFEEMAGGGGGATFIFLINSAKVAVPILVAAGGGGLGIGHLLDSDETQHGKAFDSGRIEVSGQRGPGNLTGGAGGGWRGSNLNDKLNGGSLLEGALGGKSCFNGKGTHGDGGFGGGAGGCLTGGAGGGYAGGNTYEDVSNGEGGTSFINKKRSVSDLSFIYAGDNIGPGSVVIIPALAHPACGCDYRCVVLDEFSVNVQCICPDGWRLKKDNLTACEPIYRNEIPMEYLIVFFAVVTILLIAALAALIFILYNRYQRKKQIAMRHKVLLEQDLQLSRLRHNPEDQQQSNFNPNYGNDCIINGAVDVKSLTQVTRESLRLVKPLGQGAFGEVYQGLYRVRPNDSVEMPVAVKTLPELSTGQAEADFLMEAAIMSKFKHANIVHLIGVCFDVHPRFIVLELLAGGDLKNFLRDGRHSFDRPSPLTSKDLIHCAIDVARGCRYMESKRFIHRDIAARNCLLSSKGPGRVVKIADFGMARDIYRSDYYRKGGKAMLPIKWMPPEAYLDGIFTSKTDIWSFGVLLWEVFSLGLMPYTGLPNRDVMQLVAGGGRLDAPLGCPKFVYTLMASCWHSVPDARPGFQYLLDTLLMFAEDDEFMKTPIPCYYYRLTSDDKHDQTIMRPHPNDDFCLQVPSSDYLIPLPDSRAIAERLLSEGTGITLPSDTSTTYSPPIEMKSMSSFGRMVRKIPSKQNTKFITSHAMKSRLSSNSDRLISLDTPQQTPTTVAPPNKFSDMTTTTTTTSIKKSLVNEKQQPEQQQQQTSFIDGNGNAENIEKNPTKNCQPSSTINTNINSPIQLNPATLESYVNVRLMNSTATTNPSHVGTDNEPLANNNEKISPSPPFTIEGYSNDHYNTNAKENHSEISC